LEDPALLDVRDAGVEKGCKDRVAISLCPKWAKFMFKKPMDFKSFYS